MRASRGMRLACAALAPLCAAALAGGEESGDAMAALHARFDAALAPAARPLLESEPLPRAYRIAAVYDPARGALSGHLRLDYRNTTGEALPDLGFHTFAAASCYQGATLAISAVRIDGQAAISVTPACGGAAAIVTLPSPLADGAQAAIDLDFTSGTSSTGGYHGLGNTADGTAVFYGWYPQLAQRADHEWRVHPLAQLCDPTLVEMAHVEVQLRMPAAVHVVATGAVAEQRADATGRAVRIAAPFTRDLVLVFSDKLSERHRRIGDTLVEAWSLPGDDAGTGECLDAACQSLELYGSNFGPYPYAHLQVVDAPLGADVGGMESSGLVIIDSTPVSAVSHDLNQGDTIPRLLLSLVVSHEVAHQWWYGMVGSDAWLYPYLDESLAEWTCGWFLERKRSAAMASGAWRMHLAEADGPANLAAAADRNAGDYDEAAYGGVIYARGAIMYQALREELGETAFFAFLRSWWADHRFRQVDERDWKAAIIRALGPVRGTAFIDRWLLGHGLTRLQEQAVVAKVSLTLPGPSGHPVQRLPAPPAEPAATDGGTAPATPPPAAR